MRNEKRIHQEIASAELLSTRFPIDAVREAAQQCFLWELEHSQDPTSVNARFKDELTKLVNSLSTKSPDPSRSEGK